MDEPDGTPHLHIDFIPIATGQKRGLEVKNSMRQALQQQGFDFAPTPQPPKDSRIHATYGKAAPRFGGGQWLEAERAALGAVLERHGITWEKQGIHRQHLSISEYKACAEIVSNTIKEMPSADLRTRDPNKMMQLAGVKAGEVLVSRADLEAMQQESKVLRTESRLRQDALQRMQKDKAQADAHVRRALKSAECREQWAREQYSAEKIERYDDMVKKSKRVAYDCQVLLRNCKKFEAENKQLKQQQNTQIDQAVQKATIPLQEENERLRTELHSWKQRVAALQETVRSLCQFIHDTMRAVFTLKYNYKGGYPNPCKSSLTEPASQLIDILERHAHRAMQQAGHSELEKGLDGMGLTPELSSELHIPKQRKKEQMEIGE